MEILAILFVFITVTAIVLFRIERLIRRIDGVASAGRRSVGTPFPEPAVAGQGDGRLPYRPSFDVVPSAVDASGDDAGPTARSTAPDRSGLGAITPYQTPVPSTNRFADRARRIVEANQGESGFGVSQLADALGLSPRQLQRRLRDATGLSPNAFIRSIRLRHAAERLASDDDSIAAVAADAGFSSASHFTKCFREEFGTTPLKYAKMSASEAQKE